MKSSGMFGQTSNPHEPKSHSHSAPLSSPPLGVSSAQGERRNDPQKKKKKKKQTNQKKNVEEEERPHCAGVHHVHR